MKQGDRVRVQLAGGASVVRLIWKPTSTGALICTEESYAKAEKAGGEPPTIGFRREFIQPSESTSD